jgi:hypothetical protein
VHAENLIKSSFNVWYDWLFFRRGFLLWTGIPKDLGMKKLATDELGDDELNKILQLTLLLPHFSC